jgi:tRNA pseudouridine55 synthase
MISNTSSGIVIVDKPAGMTSARLVARLKTLFSARKAGHTGTLDPFATGVMVCCINRATKLADLFLHRNKAYVATLRLGIETDTMDVTGTILAHRHIQWEQAAAHFPDTRLERIFKGFEGPMAQLPPVYSALKHKGVPLYKLARQGRPVQKPPRKIEIFKISILDIALPDIHFEVSCSAGTYIRTLCHDIGQTLGCGAFLKALRRVESCGFSIDDACSLDELEALAAPEERQKTLISMACGLHGMPTVMVDPPVIDKIVCGQPLQLDDLGWTPDLPEDELIKIVDFKGQLIALVRLNSARKRIEYRGVFISPPTKSSS